MKLDREEFPSVYETILSDPSVEIKIARIDIMDPAHIYVFVFRRANEHQTVSDLAFNPREMSKTSRFMYKWIIPLRAAKRLRFLVESIVHQPLDWSGEP